tara:strand:- start:444 stop:641 length:198 start_codon:yes stop_codon:yes gene_type:complete
MERARNDEDDKNDSNEITISLSKHTTLRNIPIKEARCLFTLRNYPLQFMRFRQGGQSKESGDIDR